MLTYRAWVRTEVTIFCVSSECCRSYTALYSLSWKKKLCFFHVICVTRTNVRFVLTKIWSCMVSLYCLVHCRRCRQSRHLANANTLASHAMLWRCCGHLVNRSELITVEHNFASRPIWSVYIGLCNKTVFKDVKGTHSSRMLCCIGLYLCVVFCNNFNFNLSRNITSPQGNLSFVFSPV